MNKPSLFLTDCGQKAIDRAHAIRALSASAKANDMAFIEPLEEPARLSAGEKIATVLGFVAAVLSVSAIWISIY